jgi:putative ABC transport system permease protein
MSSMRRLRTLWRNLAHRRSVDRDLDDELRGTFDLLADEHVSAGMRPEQARRAAMLQLGRIESIKTQVQDVRSGAGLETLGHDIRFALRLLRRSPSFTAAAIVSLTLAVGANTAVFGLLNALRLRTLPVPHADNLAEIRLNGPRCCRHTGRNRQVSLPLWQEIARQQQAFSSLFAFADTRFNLATQGEVRYVEGLYVSGELFPMLGVAALDRAGCTNAPAVISHALWQSEFARGDDVLSRTLSLRSGQHPVVGVMPPGFFGLEVGRRFDVALPVCAAGFDRRDHWWLAVMGRLKPGWTASSAEAHLAALGPALLQATVPPNYGAEQAKQFTTLKFSVRGAANGISPLRAQYEDPLWLLLGIAALVFLTACANIASLSMVRATAREPELALRFALGATRLRVVRQLLVEGALIAIAGAGAGLVLARVAADAVMAVLSTRTDPIVLDVALDWRMASFTIGVIGAAVLAFAIAPALRARRVTLHSTGRQTEGRRQLAAREVLVAMQIAMSVVLVAGALLFVLTFRNLTTMDVGFARQGILMANVFLSEEHHPANTRAAFQRALTQRLATLPGIAGVAHATTPPLGGSVWGAIVSSRTADGEIKDEVTRNQVSDGYFAVIGTTLLTGRDFNDRDTPQSPRVAIVNETFARKFFPGMSPIGQVYLDGNERFEVVGVARDSRQYFLREGARPITYTAASQVAEPMSTIRFVVRSEVVPSAAIDAVRRTITDLSPSAGIRFATMAEMTAQSIARERLLATLSGFFGVIALALAVVGVYGVVSYTAASRQREIGIRLALGARVNDVFRAVLMRIAVVGGAGLAAGLILAVSLTETVAAFLYGVQPHDPRVFAAIVLIILAAALAAAAGPVRRALAIDPVSVLKVE